MIIEKDKWYWASSVEDGDIFYPLMGAADGYVMMDGKHYRLDSLKGLRIDAAIMPDSTSANTAQS